MEEQSHLDKLQELRAIIVGPERELLDRLHDRVGNPERRTEDLVEVLAQAVALGSREDDKLIEALRAPVGECIQTLFRRDMKVFARALFPLILPAIRQAIVEALRSLVQTTNQVLDQSLSLKGLRWRWEAWRGGIPFSEVVLRHTLVYRVEQVFLIQRHTGLLMGHVHHPEAPTQDGDAVAGMLTAIGDFVQDSFQPEDGGQLDTVNLGELSLWIIHGPSAMLACAIRGIPPTELRARLREACEEIHLKFSEELERFEGDDTPLLGLETQLTQCLSFQRKKREQDKSGRPRRFPTRALILALLILSLLTLWQVRRLKIGAQTRALQMELASTAGLKIRNIQREKGLWRVDGLRDPLSEEPERAALRAGIPAEKVYFDLLPVMFLNEEMVLKRARALLQPPDTLSLQLEGSILKAEGTAPASWLREAESLAHLPAGVEGLDLQGVLDDEDALRQLALSVLKPPEGVRVEVRAGALSLKGEAPFSWVRELPDRVADLPENQITGFNIEGLHVSEHREAEALAASLGRTLIYFSGETRLRDNGLEELHIMAQDLNRLAQIAAQLELDLSVDAFGLSDQVGSDEFNRELRERRARFLRDALVERGFPENRISLATDSRSLGQPTNRAAGLLVSMESLQIGEVPTP